MCISVNKVTWALRKNKTPHPMLMIGLTMQQYFHHHVSSAVRWEAHQGAFTQENTSIASYAPHFHMMMTKPIIVAM